MTPDVTVALLSRFPRSEHGLRGSQALVVAAERERHRKDEPSDMEPQLQKAVSPWTEWNCE